MVTLSRGLALSRGEGLSLSQVTFTAQTMGVICELAIRQLGTTPSQQGNLTLHARAPNIKGQDFSKDMQSAKVLLAYSPVCRNLCFYRASGKGTSL